MSESSKYEQYAKIGTNFERNQVIKWDERLSKLLFWVWRAPVAVFIIQAIFVFGQLDLDPTKLNNWMNFDKVFAFPIAVFALLASSATLTGLYARSLHLKQQLAVANAQFATANKQYALASEQSLRADKQFEFAQKKENLSLYVEHIKLFELHVNQLIKINKIGQRIYRNTLEKETISIITQKFYRNVFPENSHSDMKNLSMVSSQEMSPKLMAMMNESIEAIKLISSKGENLQSDLLRACNFTQPMGVFIQTNDEIEMVEELDNKRVQRIFLFLADLCALFTILENLKMVDRETSSRGRSCCIITAKRLEDEQK